MGSGIRIWDPGSFGIWDPDLGSFQAVAGSGIWDPGSAFSRWPNPGSGSQKKLTMVVNDVEYRNPGSNWDNCDSCSQSKEGFQMIDSIDTVTLDCL